MPIASAGVPLLRSPPFPWIAPSVGAVSHAEAGPAREIDRARLSALVTLVRRARVGGSFWAVPAPVTAGLLLRPSRGDPTDLVRRARSLADPADTLAILPVASWAPRAARVLEDAGIRTAREPIDPWSLLAPGVRLLGDPDDEWVMLAALAGAEPIGITQDMLDDMLGKALLGDVSYRDCFSGAASTAEATVAVLADWRRTLDANRAIAVATGIAWWKRDAIGHFLWSGGPQPFAVVPDAGAAVAGARAAGRAIAVWPARTPEGLAMQAAAAGIPLVAVEDGFIRSVGLGSGLHPPWSIIVDRLGIYYDPRMPSDLEQLLATHSFPADLLERAESLRRTIVARGISKYASAGEPPRGARRSSRRTILVAGQVEDDMSVKAAGAGVAGNLDLLARARRAEPDAYLLFKPHPDVDAGHRVGRVADAELLAFADEIVRDVAMPALLARVDGVHVLTSLTGFEALLRGLDVTTHGHPFYAGWGLTRDLAGPLPRRTRALTLPQLVAATLILYPRYLDPETGLPCSPEILLERFSRQSRPKKTWLIRAREWQGGLAKLFGTTTD